MSDKSQPLEPKVYFKKQIEQITNRSIQTLRRWWEKNNFPKPILLSGRLSWHADTIEQWIKQNVQEVPHEQL